MSNQITKRPDRKDYDFNDVFEGARFASDMIQYVDYLEGLVVPVEEKHVINYTKHDYFLNISQDRYQLIGVDDEMRDNQDGLNRTTIAHCDHSLERNKQANRLEALVEDLQQCMGGDYEVWKENGVWNFSEKADIDFVGIVYMGDDTAKEVCRLLNNGLYEL